MIIEFMVELLCDMLGMALTTVSFLTLPMDAIGALSTFCAYGAYVVGADFLLCFSAIVFFWMTVKLVWGLIVYVWKLLPLT